MQAVGPVAMVCLLLSSGMIDYIPGQYDNEDPNRPANPDAQHAYNTAAIQVMHADFWSIQRPEEPEVPACHSLLDEC